MVHFDREVELLQDLTSSKEKVQQGASLLDSPEPNTGGDASNPGAQSLLYDSIYLATNEITGKQSGRKVLVLFSNGIDQGSKSSLRSAIDTAQKTGTIIYAVYVKGEIDKAQKKIDQENDPNRRDPTNYPGGYPGGVIQAVVAIQAAEAIQGAVTQADIRVATRVDIRTITRVEAIRAAGSAGHSRV